MLQLFLIHRVSEWYQSLTAHQHQKGHAVQNMCKLNVMVKWVQSQRQNVKLHHEKKSSNEQGNAHYGPRPAKVAG